jgi:hypothetical protein
VEADQDREAARIERVSKRPVFGRSISVERAMRSDRTMPAAMIRDHAVTVVRSLHQLDHN